MERFNPTPEVQNDILETASEKSEASTFAEGLSERLCSEQFLEQIKQFPSRERQTALGIAIEYNILHRDGFGFEESMNMLLEESAKVKTFDTIGRKEDVSATLYITSTAKKLGLVEPFSEDDEKAIFEFIAQNIYREGFAYHAFNGCFKKSILENGLNSSVVPWDQAELDDVAAIGKEYGHPMILGWHKIQEEKSVYFDIHPYSVYRYGIASPEWFAQFVAEGFHVPVEGNKKKAFYLRDYEMAKANIENLCTEMTSRRREDIDAGKAYSNIYNEDTVKIMNLFEKYWSMFCGENSGPKVALIPKSEVETIENITYDKLKSQLEEFHRDPFGKLHGKENESFVCSFQELVSYLILRNTHLNDQKTQKVIAGDLLQVVDLPEYKDVYPEVVV